MDLMVTGYDGNYRSHNCKLRSIDLTLVYNGHLKLNIKNKLSYQHRIVANYAGSLLVSRDMILNFLLQVHLDVIVHTVFSSK